MENNGILKSFDLQDDLNPKIWKKNSKGSYILSPKVREKLLEIAYEFIESLKVDVIVSDVHLTGSLVNFNWSQYSDFDLHIIADFTQFPKKSLHLYEELFKLKKTIFNSEQNIKIYGYDVEVFVQDENEKGHSAGIFSLISNDWLEKPKKEKFEVNKTILKKKIDQWIEKIDKILESAQEEKDLEKSKKLVSNLKEKLKDYRKIGLEKGGEMSYENLVFKYLRRSGHIEKLFDFKKDRLDKELSLREQGETNGLLGKLRKILKIDKDEEQKIDDPKKADVVDADVKELYDNLESINKDVTQQSRGEYSFQKNVESIQIGLELLGYDLPRFGVDGLYGPETASAIEKFKSDNLSGVESDSEETESEEESSTLKPPVSTRVITSPYGPRGGRMHQGIDIGVPSGTEIAAPVSGEVMHARFGSKNCGGIIWLKHAGGYETKYCHCKKINVSPGQKVKKGEIIGLTGGAKGDKGAGNSSGPHLHFEVIKDGKHLDPEKVLDKTKVGGYKGSGVVNSIATLETIKTLISKLKSKGIKSEDLKPFVDVSRVKPIKISEGQLSSSKDIIEFLKNKGLSDEQASGIAGNLFIESGFKTDALGDNGTSYGLAQWHEERWDRLKEFIRQKDYDINSIEGQMEYLWWELTGPYSSVLDELKKSYTPADSATIFASKYEKPASRNYSNRVQAAENLYEKYTGKKIINKDKEEVAKEFTSRNDLPTKIQSAIKSLENKIGRKITDDDIRKEFEQEGNWREDAGGVNPEAKSAINRLLSDLRKKFPGQIPQGIISDYRSYNDQVENFKNKINSGRNFEDVQRATTIPGFTQHHTGKAFDIVSLEPSWWNSRPEIKKWVAENCKNYGFDVTYKVQGPVRMAEPWHLYYGGNFSQAERKIENSSNDKKMNENSNFFVNDDGKNLKKLGEDVGISLKRNTGSGGEYNPSKYKSYKKNSSVFWAVYDMNSNQLLGSSSNASTNIYGASVPKVCVAAAAFANNDGVLKNSDYEKVIKLLTKSDNTVWNDIQKLAGGPKGVNDWAESMGYRMKPARNAGNQSNAIDMCKFWSDAYNNKFKGADSILRISSSCKTSGSRSLKLMPSNVYIGGKTGTYNEYNHDSCWIQDGGKFFSITVLTELGSSGSEAIAQMFRGLYDEYCA